MSRDALPEPWRSALERRGIHSKRGLATKAGISPQTAKRLIDGEGTPSLETVTAVADAVFDGDRTKVWGLAGAVRQDHGDWAIPQSLASQLDDEQRAAVLAVVRAMIPAEQRGRGDHGGRNTAPTKGPGSGPGKVVEMPRRTEVQHEDLDAAARRGQSGGRAQRREIDAAGEENQDTRGEDPS